MVGREGGHTYGVGTGKGHGGEGTRTAARIPSTGVGQVGRESNLSHRPEARAQQRQTPPPPNWEIKVGNGRKNMARVGRQWGINGRP